MAEEVGDGVEQRLARLEETEQRLVQAIELLERQGARPRRNWDAYAAVIASLIGVLALAVSAYTARVQRQQLRAQVWPNVRVSYSDVELAHYVTNAGTGPARISAVRVTFDGAQVKDWSEVRKKAGFAREEVLIRSAISSAVLSPGTKRDIIKAGDDERSQNKFRELLPGGKHKITIEVCYCSVLDECWTAGIDAVESVPRDCPIAASERFEE
jgi:hypothetical protein